MTQLSRKSLNSIIILGGGTAGWMTAAAFSHHYRHAGITITLIESSAIGTIGVGEATIPTLRRFTQSLGISDADLINATNSSVKLGIAFDGWAGEGTRLFHPFGPFGQDMADVEFHHYYNRQRSELPALDRFSLGASLAQAGRFALPSPNVPPFAFYDWAVHFDAALFAGFLQQKATDWGVRRIDARLTEVTRDPDNGFVTALRLDSGETVAGDLFVDCSGFQSLLLGKALDVPYEDWSHWLLCDGAWAVQSERSEAPVPYTRVIARPAGWQWHIPLQHRSGNGHVFGSRFMMPEAARDLLMQTLPGAPVTEPRLIRFTPGRRSEAWAKNVVGIGLSSGFLEPLESTSIALIQTGIERLRQLLPVDGFDPRLTAEYNIQSQEEFERVRDFVILHYYLNRRDEPFWQAARDMTVPDSLLHKLNLYQSRGHFVRYRYEMFHPQSWLAILGGFGVWPESLDPGTAQVPPDYMRQHLQKMVQQIEAQVARAPSHQAFLDHCRKSLNHA